MITEGLRIALRYWWLILACLAISISIPLLKTPSNIPAPLPGANSIFYYQRVFEMPTSDAVGSFSTYVDKELNLKITSGEGFPGFFQWAKENVTGFDQEIFIPSNVHIDTETRAVTVFAQGASQQSAIENAKLFANSLRQYMDSITDLNLGQSKVKFISGNINTMNSIAPAQISNNKMGELVLASFSGIFAGLCLAMTLNAFRQRKSSRKNN